MKDTLSCEFFVWLSPEEDTLTVRSPEDARCATIDRRKHPRPGLGVFAEEIDGDWLG